MATISGLTFSTGTPPQGPIGSTATLTGTGFGATQGTTALLVQTSYGELYPVNVLLWTSTSIQFLLDLVSPAFSGFETLIGQERFFTLVFSDGTSVRSPNFVVAEDPTPMADLAAGIQKVPIIVAVPGYPEPPEGPGYPSRGLIRNLSEGGGYDVGFFTAGPTIIRSNVSLIEMSVVREPLLTYMANHNQLSSGGRGG